MGSYFLRRFLLIPPTLLGVTLVVFLITRIVPGGPAERVVKPGQDHHPHGLKDVTPVVQFFTDALGAK